MVSQDPEFFEQSLRNLSTADAVSLYLSLGWSIFPLRPKDKLPYVELLPVKTDADGKQEQTGTGKAKRTWELFQKAQPQPETVTAWLKRAPEMNIAIVCGAVSGIVVLDIDSEEGEAIAREKGLPRTPVVKTGKGRHYYFKHPGMPISNFARKLPGVDLRGDGGYVVGPPSVHPSGAVYTWEVGPGECDLAEMPGWLLKLGRGEEEKSETPRQERQTESKAASGGNQEGMPERYYEDIARALGVTGYDAEGWSNAVRDPLHHHEHDGPRPAAHWHREKKILHCFKCHGTGEWYLAKEVADAVGIDWRNYRNEQPRRRERQEELPSRAEEWAAMGVIPPDRIIDEAERGARAQTSQLEVVRDLLERIASSLNGERAELIEAVARLIVALPAVHRTEQVKALRKATGFGARDVDAILKEASERGREGEGKGRKSEDGESRYFVSDGKIMRWAGEEVRRVANFWGRYVAESRVDYGDGFDAQLIADLEIHLRDGRVYMLQIPTEDTGEPQKLIKTIRGVAGVAASVEANEQKHLCPALDSLSMDTVLTRSREIAHTGWTRTDGGWAFVTPGGIVGDLSPGVVVRLRDDSARVRADLDAYKVVDEGEEAWAKGVDAFWGLAFAFEAEITFPALAFAFLPVLARFLPDRSKFVLHLVGRTGTLKTSFALAVMSLYGDWAYSRPTFMWESTPNSIEKGGFPLKDVLALVDDYKPEVVAEGTIVSFIQRYTAGTGRGRLDRASRLMADRPFRAWMMSTGEDLPTSVSSVMSRVVSLRLRPREAGQVVNEELQKAQSAAAGLKTVMARFVAWVGQQSERGDFSAALREEMEGIRRVVVMNIQEDVPNRDRIGENIALLLLVWRWVRRFLTDQGVQDGDALLGGFDTVTPDGQERLGAFARGVIGSITHVISSGRPTARFLEGLAALLDKKLAHIVARSLSPKDTPMNVVGWFEADGTVYLGSQAYEDVERYLRMSGGSIGASRNELYRLLGEEGKLASKEGMTEVVRCGGVNRRVLKLLAGVIEVPTGEDGGGEDEGET